MAPVVVRWARAVGRGDAHLLLTRAVAERSGTTVDAVELHHRCPRCGAGDHGRPSVSVRGTPGPAVSLARSGDLVVVAVGVVEVGVDVEHTGGVALDGLEDVALAPAERARLRGLRAGDRDHAVLRAWVAKEALLKAHGTGLAVDPASVELDDTGSRIVAWSAAGRAPTLRLAPLDLGPGVVAAVARAGGRRLRVDVRAAWLSG